MCSGSVHTRKTSSRGASTSRVAVISRLAVSSGEPGIGRLSEYAVGKVRHLGRGTDGHDLECRQVAAAVEQTHALTQEQRREMHVELVHDAGPERLPDRVGAARNADVFGASGSARLGQRALEAVGHEIERGAARPDPWVAG